MTVAVEGGSAVLLPAAAEEVGVSPPQVPRLQQVQTHLLLVLLVLQVLATLLAVAAASPGYHSGHRPGCWHHGVHGLCPGPQVEHLLQVLHL